MAANFKVSLKLLIDTKGQRVLFAEAGKEFVDFLLYLLHLPVGTVTRLLTKESMVGTLGNLYESIENLSNTYLQPNQNKDSLLKPAMAPTSATTQVPQLLPNDEGESASSRTFYRCSNSSYYHYQCVADDPLTLCPENNCKSRMNKVLTYVYPEVAKEAGGAGEGGFVKGVVTYMVMDDLAVKPMSTISSITLLNKFNVQDVGALEERVVDFKMAEGLKLLRASLLTKTVLTSVFLGRIGGKSGLHK